MALPKYIQKAQPAANTTIVFLMVTLVSICGCTTNPATGKRVISFNSLAEEKRIGKREHPKIIKQFGGVCENRKINNYVSKIGHQLALVSELPSIGWTFTVLNSKEVNAFATPGGFIYVTRGLLALAGNEAELAGVLAHEIGHITALHSSSRQATGKIAGLGALAAGILFGRTGSEIGNLIGRVSIQKYSQSQEFEADSLGVRYLYRSGYHSGAMASFLKKMRAFSKLQNRKLNRPENSVDDRSIFASHPRTIERVERAIQMASLAQPMKRIGRVKYMQNLHGLIFGDSKEQGYIRGRSFIHTDLRFKFNVPKGFHLINYPNAVIAKNNKHSLFQFDIDSKPYNGNMAQYLQNIWLTNVALSKTSSIRINGMNAATTTAQISRLKGKFHFHFVAARRGKNSIFRMIFSMPSSQELTLRKSIHKSIYSLKTISPQEALSVKPLKILVTAINKDHNVRILATKMGVNNFKEETFRVLNGLGPNQRLRKGQLVKLVVN